MNKSKVDFVDAFLAAVAILLVGAVIVGYLLGRPVDVDIRQWFLVILTAFLGKHVPAKGE